LKRSIARLLVCFYVLASCRALIPGLCATQAAIVDAQRDAGSAAVAATTHTCCSLVQPKQDASGQAPAGNQFAPKCAFCELVKGYVTPSLVVTVDLATESHFERLFSVTEIRFASRVWDPGLARDPPDSIPA